ncbi:hypothetical protein N0V84_000696 [Fusarium piperis]|uniref:glucan 1,3-beta-glucosidase n=1 Tax=Fusarium piperis TaxID=1435070 RepID=A0A9W9BTT7_9HYPO|nr:hypothetical protein N0V84_000696 [Fusarium piperis]
MAEESWKKMNCGPHNDEWTCVEGIGQAAADKASKKHWETWMTEEDIKQIASLGLSVAMKNPGFYTPENYERAARFLEWMTKRIHTNGNYTPVGMIEVMNEPVRSGRWKTEATDMRKNFYPKAFHRIQAMEDYLDVAESDRLHIQFMGKAWGARDPREYLPESDLIFFDSHRYLSFDNRIPGNKRPYIETACDDYMGENVYVGEWPLSVNSTLKNTDEFRVDGQETWYRNYWAAQVEPFEKSDGWFFWSWKCVGKVDWRWCYKSAVAASVILKDARKAAIISQCSRY